MLKDLLSAAEKPNGWPLLIVLLAISLVVLAPDRNLLVQPLQPALLALPIAVLISYGLLWGSFSLVRNLNGRLEDNDIASWEPMLGCTACRMLAGVVQLPFNASTSSFA